MKIASKIKLLLPLLTIVLFYLSYEHFIDGYEFSKDITAIAKDDLSLMNELREIDGNLSLNSIDSNLDKIKKTLKFLFIKSNISNIDSVGGIDRIGEFRDIVITADGDFLQQVYFLQKVKTGMRNLLVIDAILGNNQQMVVNARVYGSTITN